MLCLFIYTMQMRAGEMDIYMGKLKQNKDAIYTILRMNNVDSLRMYYHTLHDSDEVLRIIYCSRYLDIQNDDNVEIELLQTLLRNQQEFIYFYCLTYNPFREKKIDSALNDIANSYFEKTAHIVLNHRSFVQNYFRMGNAVDGEITEIYAIWCSWLFEQDCVWFLNNLSKAPKKTEDRILDLLKELEPPSLDCLNKNINNVPKKYLKLFKQ